jgi:hypothetical protein
MQHGHGKDNGSALVRNMGRTKYIFGMILELFVVVTITKIPILMKHCHYNFFN